MKAIEQYFHVVLFITLYKVVQTLTLWMKPLCVTIQMKAIEQYFYLVLFIMLRKVFAVSVIQMNVFVFEHFSNIFFIL